MVNHGNNVSPQLLPQWIVTTDVLGHVMYVM